MKPPVPQLLMIVFLFISTLAIILAGYIHGNMHIEKVWESLHS